MRTKCHITLSLCLDSEIDDYDYYRSVKHSVHNSHIPHDEYPVETFLQMKHEANKCTITTIYGLYAFHAIWGIFIRKKGCLYEKC